MQFRVVVGTSVIQKYRLDWSASARKKGPPFGDLHHPSNERPMPRLFFQFHCCDTARKPVEAKKSGHGALGSKIWTDFDVYICLHIFTIWSSNMENGKSPYVSEKKHLQITTFPCFSVPFDPITKVLSRRCSTAQVAGAWKVVTRRDGGQASLFFFLGL